MSCANRALTPGELVSTTQTARQPIEVKRQAHEEQLRQLSERWDAQRDTASPQEKRATLEALRERLLERNYINNLLASIDREKAHTGESA